MFRNKENNSYNRFFILAGILVGLLAIGLSYGYSISRKSATFDLFSYIEDQSSSHNLGDVLTTPDYCFLPGAGDEEWTPSNERWSIGRLNEYITHMYGEQWVFFEQLASTDITQNLEDGRNYQYDNKAKLFVDSEAESGLLQLAYQDGTSQEISLREGHSYYLGEVDLSQNLKLSVCRESGGSEVLEEPKLYVFRQDLYDQWKYTYSKNYGSMKYEHDTYLVHMANEEEGVLFFRNYITILSGTSE